MAKDNPHLSDFLARSASSSAVRRPPLDEVAKKNALARSKSLSAIARGSDTTKNLMVAAISPDTPSEAHILKVDSSTFIEAELEACIESPSEGADPAISDNHSAASELQRYSTVKQFAKFDGPAKIEAVSPLNNAKMLEVDTPIFSSSSIQAVLSSSILAPMRHSNSTTKPNPSVFRELQMRDFEDNQDKYSFEIGENEEVTTKEMAVEDNLFKAEKTYSRRTFWQWVVVLLVVLGLVIGGLVAVVVLLSRGTRRTVLSYFSHASAYDRSALLTTLQNRYPVSPNYVKSGSMSDFLMGEDFMNEGRRLGGFDSTANNNFKGLPEQFKSDEAIRKLMVEDVFREDGGPIFYGVNYSPLGALEPQCESHFRDVQLDVARLSKVTKRIKNYGMQCNQSEYILEAIQQLNLNMTLAMGVWITNDPQVNEGQMVEMERVLRKFPRHLFELIYIGNEVLFRRDQTEVALIDYIKRAREFVRQLGSDFASIPVGTTEIGSLISVELARACNVVGANVHPFFGGEVAEMGADWTFDFVRTQLEPKLSGLTKIVITEVGWPYSGGKHSRSEATPANFQAFMDKFVCDAYQNNYGWFYFEAFDEPWKSIFYEGDNRWETEWGVFNRDRTMKRGIAFPRCK